MHVSNGVCQLSWEQPGLQLAPVGTEIGQCTQKLPRPLLTMALVLFLPSRGASVVLHLKGEGALKWMTDMGLYNGAEGQMPVMSEIFLRQVGGISDGGLQETPGGAVVLKLGVSRQGLERTQASMPSLQV